MSKEIKDIHYDPEIDKLVGEFVEVVWSNRLCYLGGQVSKGVLSFTHKNDISGCPYILKTNFGGIAFYKSHIKSIKKVG